MSTPEAQLANQHNVAVNDHVNRLWALFSPTVGLLTEAGLLVVWAFGIWMVARNQVTVGVLTAFLTYIGRFYIRLDSMSRIVSVTQKAAAGAKRIFDILDHVSSVPEPVNPVHLPHVKGTISLHDVGFRYGSRSIIRNLNLTIEPGEMIQLHPRRIGQHRLQIRCGKVAVHPEADEMLIPLPVADLHQTQTVAWRHQPHRLRINRNRPRREHAFGQIFFVEIHCHAAGLRPIGDWWKGVLATQLRNH